MEAKLKKSHKDTSVTLYSRNRDIYEVILELLYPTNKEEMFNLPNDIDWETLIDETRTLSLMNDISFLIEEQLSEFSYDEPYFGADLGAGFSAILAMAASNTLTRNNINHLIYAVEIHQDSYKLMDYFIGKMGFSGKIRPVHGDALTWTPSIKLDWVSAEIFDSIGINEPGPHIVQRLQKYLNKTGRSLPDRMEVWATIRDDYETPLADPECIFKTDFTGLGSYIDSCKQITIREPGIPSYVTLTTDLYSRQRRLQNTGSFCPRKDFPVNEHQVSYDESDVVSLHVHAEFLNENVSVKLY